MKSFIRKHTQLLIILLIIGISVLSARNMLRPGFPHEHDTLWHVQRITVMFEELSSGQFPVRWAGELDNHYGIPLFNFVYPLPYYLAAAGMFAGLGNLTMLKLVTVLSYSLGGVGMYLLFRKKIWVGLTVSLLYLFTPYQFVNIFVRHALGEIMVMGLLPWAFLMAGEIEKKKKLLWYHPIPLALVLLSHNFLGLIASALIIIYSLLSNNSKRAKIKSVLVSFVLSAFFLLPMILERIYLLSAQKKDFSFLYSEHYIYPKQLIYSRWDYWFSMPGIDLDGMTFQLGFANIASIVLALLSLWLWKKYKDRKLLIFWLVTTLLAIFITTPASSFIWDTLPLLQAMQFPWRFLAFTSISTVALAGIFLFKLESKNKIPSYVIAVSLVILALINTRNYHRPVRILDQEEFQALHTIFADKTTTSLRSELVPKWAPIERWEPDADPARIGKRVAKLRGGLEVIELEESARGMTIRAVAENDETQLKIYRNYFPTWKATIDGQPVELEPTSSGEIIMPLLEGDHIYKLFVGQTSLEKLANLISLSGIGYLFYLAFKK